MVLRFPCAPVTPPVPTLMPPSNNQSSSSLSSSLSCLGLERFSGAADDFGARLRFVGLFPVVVDCASRIGERVSEGDDAEDLGVGATGALTDRIEEDIRAGLSPLSAVSGITVEGTSDAYGS